MDEGVFELPLQDTVPGPTVAKRTNTKDPDGVTLSLATTHNTNTL